MPRQHKTLLIPGNNITEGEAIRAGGAVENGQPLLVGPYSISFNDGHSMLIFVTNSSPPQLTAELRNNLGETVESLPMDGPIDQDYSLDDGGTTYEVTLTRAANTVLTPEAITLYEQDNGGHCPACASTDIHASTPQADGPVITVRVECCSCAARWVDTYEFKGISEIPEDWEPPQQNVQQHRT